MVPRAASRGAEDGGHGCAVRESYSSPQEARRLFGGGIGVKSQRKARVSVCGSSFVASLHLNIKENYSWLCERENFGGEI